jgi:hypothetical protein
MPCKTEKVSSKSNETKQKIAETSESQQRRKTREIRAFEITELLPKLTEQKLMKSIHKIAVYMLRLNHRSLGVQRYDYFFDKKTDN